MFSHLCYSKALFNACKYSLKLGRYDLSVFFQMICLTIQKVMVQIFL